MLEDAPRNEAYRKAISANKSYINGKVILDVGAGTGKFRSISGYFNKPVTD